MTSTNLGNTTIQVRLSNSNTKTLGSVILTSDIRQCKQEKPGCIVHKWLLWFISTSDEALWTTRSP
jgi:hypothetical protein